MNYYDQHIIRCLEKIERGRNSVSRNEEQLAKSVQRQPNNSQNNLTRTLSPSYGVFESKSRNQSLYLSNDDPASEHAKNNGQTEDFLVYCKRCHPYSKNNSCDTHRHAIIFNPTYEEKNMVRKSCEASPSEHTFLPCRCNVEEKSLFPPNQNVLGAQNICYHCKAQARNSSRGSEYRDFDLSYPSSHEGYCECEMPFGSIREKYCTCNKRVSENNADFEADSPFIQMAGENKFCECKKQIHQVAPERNYVDWDKSCDNHDCTRKSQYGINEGKYCNCPRSVQSPEGKKYCNCDQTKFFDRNKPEPQKPFVSDYYHSVAVQYSYPMIHQSQLPNKTNFVSIDEANPLIPIFLTRESLNEVQKSNQRGNRNEPLKLQNYNTPVELSHLFPKIRRSGDSITLKSSNHTVGENYSLPQATLKKPIVVLAVPDSRQAQADKPHHNPKENEIPLLPDVLKIPTNLNKNTCHNCLKKIKIVDNPRKPTEKHRETDRKHDHHKQKRRHSDERHHRKTELPKYETRGVLHFVDRVPDI